jgi:uncharacterized sulfatase
MVEDLAISIDIVPTLLKAAGLQPTAAMQGVDLLDDAAVKARHTIFGECFTHNAIDLNQPAANLRWRWVVNGYDKLIVPHKANQPDDPVELYDLKADPNEEKNVAADHPEKVKELSAKLDGWWKP